MGKLIQKVYLQTRTISDIHQIGWYAITGIVSNFVGYVVYLTLTSWYFDPKVAMTLVYVTAASVAYVGNGRWTFNHRGNMLQTLIRYGLAHAVGYTINLSLLYVFVDRLSYPHQSVQIVAIFVVAGILFFLFKHFVFLRAGSADRSQ